MSIFWAIIFPTYAIIAMLIAVWGAATMAVPPVDAEGSRKGARAILLAPIWIFYAPYWIYTGYRYVWRKAEWAK